MLKHAYILIVQILPIILYGQTVIVSNGSFEEYGCLPTNFAQIECATGWNNPMIESCDPTQSDTCSTPDYYHLEGSGYGQLPSTFAAYVQPFDGSAVAGFIAWNPAGVREYIVCQMNNSLISGHRYNVKLWITNGLTNLQSTLGAGWGIEGVGLAFSTYEPVQLTYDTISIVPQLICDSLLFSENWTQLSFSLVADSTYTHLCIGNFQSNLTTNSYEFIETNTIGNNAYYYIDNLSIVDLDSISSVPETTSIIEHIRQDQETIAVSLTIQSSEPVTVGLYDMAGKRVTRYNEYRQQSITIPIGHLTKGVYILNVETMNGNARRKIVVP